MMKLEKKVRQMFKLLAENKNSYSYLVVIEGVKYTIEVSNNGKLLDISPYVIKMEVSSNNRRMEFG